MKSYPIAKSRRIRSTPYTSRIEKQGVTAYTVYNHMLLPAAFGSLEESCDHLKKNVQVWDVSAERQVEISGHDSAKLIQLMTCRDLSKSKIGRCYYCPIIDENGNLVNDPVILKLAKDRWWVSIADSDVIFFAKGLASGNNFNVKIFEPNEKILPKFLFYILKTLQIRDLGYSRHFKELKNKEIPLPPFEVQQEIVDELEGYQKIIDGCKQVVRNYKPAIDIDPSWEMVELGEICTFAYGKGLKESDRLGGSDPYSASKAVAELIFKSYYDSFFSNNKKILIASARAGNVIGGNDWTKDRFIPDVIRSIQKNKV